MATMTELKRKREDVDDGKSEDEVAGTNDIAPTQSTSSSPSCQSTPPPPQQCSSEEEGEIRSHGDGSATSTRVVSVAADKADKPTAKSAAADRQTILICGKEVVLKSTGGRKRRKHPIETLVILAYKSRLAITCQANDMVGALEIHREMKNKGVKQDLSTHLMVIAVCGGSPGGKDELDPGNGSTTPCAAAAAGNKAAASEVEQDADSSASRGAEPRSAQANAFAAAEAALQIFSEASKDGTVTLPESAYTSVIRACCLDGRPDRAREILGSLKRAGGKPRVRTYAPLLEAYAGLDGRLEDCLAVWRDAVSAPDGLTMTEREYLHLIAACTRARDEERFLEVMDEYMDDVLQPRSRHSWDVLKAWFLAAGGRENTTTTTTTTTATTAAATMSATAAATGTVAATTAVAADSTTEKCEEEDDEEMTPVLPRDVDDDGGDGCGHGDSAEEKRTPRETRGAETTVAVEPPNAPDKDGDGGVALASESAEEQMQVTPETETAAAAAEAPNALEKDRAVDAASPAAPSPLYVEGPSTPPPTSNAEERVRETLETESTAAAEPPNAPEKDGAVVAAPPLAPSPVDADGAATPPPPMTAATASVSAADGDGNSDVASSTRPPRTADDSSEAACGAQPSGGDGGDGGDGAGAGNGGGGGACGDWIVSECRVGDDGSCGSCGEVLRSIDLSKDDEERLLKQIEVLVCTNEQRTKQWEGFCASIERRGKERYDVIIDGANVGYFKKNAAGAGELADLRQVDWAVKKYEEEGKKPLVVLHSRHIVEKRLSAEAKAIVARWKEAGILQTCAPKNNDDWYWLHAAVYTGGKVLVLTNDEMRDHHFSMLSHRSFQRWKERHQARFHFGSWKDDVREVVTDEPPLYSKRTQKSERSFHIPLLGSRDWLCATRQPRKTAKSSSSSSGGSQAAAIAEGR